MRRARSVHRAGLSVAVALVLLTACGGSGKDNSASSTKASSSASETTAKAAGSEFCTQAAAVESNVGSAVTDSSNPASVKQALQDAVAKIRAIHAPSEISADWTALADGVEQLATAFGNVDFKDPNAVASFQATASNLEKQLSGASANVEKYLSDKCGLTVPSQSAAPTS
jgi:citrate lyase alpha subunit